MKIKGKEISISRVFYLTIYYGIAYKLPRSKGFWGKLLHTQQIRYSICKHIFAYIGKNVNIEKGAFFGAGIGFEIGDNSGLGINCCVPGNTSIGANVMMGPNCYILGQNHRFDRTDIPMIEQGYVGNDKRTII